MKISIDPDSPDHWRRHFAKSPVVKVDGAVVRYVLSADDERGEVVVSVPLMEAPASEGLEGLPRKTLRGTVEIVEA